MGSQLADISIEFDIPSVGLATFTALNEREIGFLQWMAEDLVDGSWDGKSLSLPIKDADTVYQTGLMNGLVFDFGNGQTIGLPPEALADIAELIAQIDTVAQLNQLDHDGEE